jgi:asparagine synthase (glutamine-hydrolysing)
MDGLVVDELSRGHCSILWAAAPSAPVDRVHAADGMAVLWGLALPPHPGLSLDALGLLTAWGREGPERAPAASGFHAGVVFTEAGGLVVGCDPLGLFPVYHWSGPTGLTVVSSSPALIRLHPAFEARQSLEGLAGILLTGGPVSGRTLLEGVSRLGPGRLLIQPRNGVLKEVSQNVSITAKDDVPRSLDEAADLFDQELTRAVQRHAPLERRPLLLLSGGRDSRLLAGSLHRSGRDYQTVTLGMASDFDASCARSVAQALGVPNRLDEVPFQSYADLAALHLRAEEVLGHFAGVHNWGMGSVLGSGDGSVMTGHMLGHIAGGVDLGWAGASGSEGLSEAAFWGTVERHAIGIARLQLLIRDAGLKAAVEEIGLEIRGRFQRSADRLEDRVREYVLGHWARHHPGATPWRLSFASWPSIPALDAEVLAAAASLAAPYARKRELQDAILRRHHPVLAPVPLVRSSGSQEPVEPDLRWRLAAAARRVGERLGVVGPEPRDQWLARDRYRRIYDLDNEGWVAIRRRAEPFRERLLHLFHATALRDFLPPPDQPLRLERPIDEGYGRKCMLGLMLLAGTE